MGTLEQTLAIFAFVMLFAVVTSVDSENEHGAELKRIEKVCQGQAPNYKDMEVICVQSQKEK